MSISDSNEEEERQSFIGGDLGKQTIRWATAFLKFNGFKENATISMGKFEKIIEFGLSLPKYGHYF